MVSERKKTMTSTTDFRANKRTILDSVLGVLPEGAAQELEKAKLDRIVKKWKENS